MIIWLASYPKSGNTWIRALLCSYLYSDKGEFNFNLLDKIDQFPGKKYLSSFVQNFNKPMEIPQFWIPAQTKINLNKKINILKTHNSLCKIEGHSFTNNKNTAGVVYIVRDPRNVVTSLKHHL